MFIMKDIRLFSPTKNDLNELKDLWHCAFDSSDAELFFDFFYNQDLCLVSKANNITVSMGHLLPIGNLIINDNPPIPTAMIYAVATLPEYRKQGLGSATSGKLIQLAQSVGYPAAVLCPAIDSLFDFYDTKTSMEEWFYANEYTLKAPFNMRSRTTFTEISANEYMLLRESLLQGISHIRLNQRTVKYQKGLCELFGGGLFKVSTPLGDSCAIVERLNCDLIYIKELLMPKNILNSTEHFEYLQDIAFGVISIFPAVECVIRSPAIVDQSPIPNMNIDFVTRRFAMLSLPPMLQSIANITTPKAWYGPAFD